MMTEGHLKVGQAPSTTSFGINNEIQCRELRNLRLAKLTLNINKYIEMASA
jgi:hypothetical protein